MVMNPPRPPHLEGDLLFCSRLILKREDIGVYRLSARKDTGRKDIARKDNHINRHAGYGQIEEEAEEDDGEGCDQYYILTEKARSVSRRAEKITYQTLLLPSPHHPGTCIDTLSTTYARRISALPDIDPHRTGGDACHAVHALLLPSRVK